MKKKIIIICAVIAIILVAIGVYFLIKMNKLKEYRNAEVYTVNGEEIISVKTAIGDRELVKCSQSEQLLELTFEDPDKEKSVEDYMKYLVDNGTYIRANLEDSNKRQISKSADNSENVVVIETELTDKGFKLKIQVGPGQIKVDPIE